MNCPKCGRANPDRYRFCEIDGAPLVLAEPPAAASGCRCGAPADSVDELGWCTACGRRAAAPSRDHREIVRTPNFCAVTDKGRRHRDNEDDVALEVVEVQGKPAYVAVVCDGVSSSAHAAAASHTAALHARDELVQAARGPWLDPPACMRRAIRAAHDAVCREEHVAGGGQDPPATTIAAVVAKDGCATIGWVGDSRVYWFEGARGGLLTQDHASGHALTRCLGAALEGESREPPEPSVVQFAIPPGAWLLVCSDGLWNYAADPVELAALALREPRPTDDVALARRFVEFANASGGKDNVTVAVIRP